jgi:hypothetical protein
MEGSRMIRALAALGVFAVGLPALAQPPIVAAVPGDGAAFAVGASAAGAARPATAEGDGAQLVACGVALVAATRGSRLVVDCTEGGGLALERGAFRVAVGAAGATIRLGEAALRAASVRVWAMRRGDQWLVRFERDGEAGSIQIAGAAAPEGTEAPEPGALAPDELHAIAGSAPAAAAPDAAAVATFREAAELLAPRPRPRPALAPRRVESADDLATGAATAAAGTDEIEIEAIEVEAGCIEVCVD